MTSSKEAVLFNSDTLSKIISYLSSIDVLNLALTCTKFSVSKLTVESLIEESASIAIQDIATEEQLAALPHYNGESSLADYHYLQLMREPLTFDQLVGKVAYVNSGDKSCVKNDSSVNWGTALSNNILRAGKHYASFKLASHIGHFFVGVMRPGQANQNTSGAPFESNFFNHFSRNTRHDEHNDNNKVHCCFYFSFNGMCRISESPPGSTWEGMEHMSSGDEAGMLLDLDEGTLSVYKNRRRLGVMKSGLIGPYCWVVSLYRQGDLVSIKRGTIPS